ncbi:oligosaccharide flippase family protein [Congregibacter brevis]|uniref:Oligosaccharide flippase family protein n=1 Tax=Congregibacter brevis TaxID=3081201 RepID=A0ABZ0IHI8_9GAMM|nr:oligosaccharide flippase family protein [Congregibacter sp. IMCC45268]
MTALVILKGSTLFTITRLVQRALGLISLVVLARILAPEDFGLVALASIFLVLSTDLSSLGSEPYLLQKTSVEDVDLHTAWSVSILAKFSLFALLVIASPALASILNESRLALIIPIASSGLLIRAFANPAVVLLKRKFLYKKIFVMGVLTKFISVTVVIVLAVNTRSFWALIVGDLVGAVVSTILSYVFVSARIGLSLKNWASQWGYVRWVLPQTLLGSLRGQLDKFLLGRVLPAEMLGGYHVSRSLIDVPAVNLLGPLSEPLLASFAQVRDSGDWMRRQFRVAFLGLYSLVFPLIAIFNIFSDEIVQVVFGAKWAAFAPITAALSWSFVVWAGGNVLTKYCLATSRTRFLFFYTCLMLTTMTIVLLSVGAGDLVGLVYARVVSDLIVFSGVFTYVSMKDRVNMPRLLALLCIPLASTILSTGFMMSFDSVGAPTSVVSLIVRVSLLCGVYVLCLIAIFQVLKKYVPECEFYVKLAQSVVSGCAAAVKEKF